jgi:hypothetical protein
MNTNHCEKLKFHTTQEDCSLHRNISWNRKDNTEMALACSNLDKTFPRAAQFILLTDL